MTVERPAVAFINNFPGTSLGGGEVQLLSLLGGLVAGGLRPIVVCERGSVLCKRLTEFPQVAVLPAELGVQAIPATLPRITRELRGVDVVQGTGFLTNLLARWIGHTVGAPVVNTVHVVPGASALQGEPRAVRAARRAVDWVSAGSVDRFVAVSQAVAQELAATGVPAGRITVIPNGIEAATERPQPDRDAVDNGSSDPRIGFVGRLEKIKGCDLFLRAAARLLETYPNARFVVAGQGAEEDRLKRLAESLGLEPRVEFLGFVDRVTPVMATLDVVVVPSLSESFGLTALEALSLGVPVVAAEVGGLSELILDGETGLLVPPGNVDAIATAVLRLLAEPEWARALGIAGARLVAARYSAGAMIDSYLALYGELLR